MRLGLVIYGSLDQLSGGYLYDRMVVQALRRRGHTVQIIELTNHGYLRNLLSGLAGSPPAISGLECLLQDELCHPSLVGINRRLRRSGYTGRLAALLHHPLSAERRPGWVNMFYRWVERAYLAGVEAVVCTSHATRSALDGLARPDLPSLVAQPGRDHVGGGLDPELIRRRAQQPGPLQILFLGNLIPRKGLDALLQALAGLEPASWELSVAGSPEVVPGFARRLRRQADGLGLNGRVRWLGPLSHPELEKLLPRMHLLAVPSHHEGFGIAYLEGMAFGLPALASASGGAGDLVREAVNGYLITPGDVRTLTERIRHLIDDRGHLAEMGIAARRTWEAHPAWAETAAAVEAYLTNSPAEIERSPRPGAAHGPEEGAP